jgi:soluble lytic murein transglycosylase-like protein
MDRRWVAIFGLVGILGAAAPVTAQSRTPRTVAVARPNHGPYAQEIAQAAYRYDVPERLIRAVIRVESGYDPHAVSRKGARGLMQLMPETAAMLGVRDAFDPQENIDGGTRHLRAMMARFPRDLRLAIAAYNAGEKPVVAHRGIPPYPETREYVQQVLRLYDSSVDWRRLPGGVHRIVEPTTNTVVYTNIPYGHFAGR